MKRDALLAAREVSWTRLHRLLDRAETVRGVSSLDPAELRELSELYRSLAADLMSVRRDRLGPDLEQHLDVLASRAHNALYARTRAGLAAAVRFRDLLGDFPGAVRRNGRLVVLALCLFYVPLVTSWALAAADETYAQAILSEQELEGMEEMYRRADPAERTSDTNLGMTGFYVFNNVGIALRCFATGLAFGLGPIFLSIYNGLHIGTVLGHLSRVGLGGKIFPFVSTHSPWELNAIVLAAAAGLQMGLALVITRGRSRVGNLQAHGLEVLRQIVGASAFLGLAAVLEGNVSPSTLPDEAKYALGALGWVLVIGILALHGRRRALPADVRALRGLE